MDDFDEYKTSMDEVTANVVEIARELKWKVKPDDMTKLLQSHTILTNEALLLMDEQRKWFLEMESIAGEDAL